MKLPAFLLSVLLLSPGGSVLAQDPSRHEVEAIMLVHPVVLDGGGKLQASAGLYAKVREDRDGSYYAAGRFSGSGILTGRLPPQIDGMADEAAMLGKGRPGGRGGAVYYGRGLKYLLVKTDGVTLCAADDQFYAIGCIKTDALRTTRPKSPPPPVQQPDPH